MGSWTKATLDELAEINYGFTAKASFEINGPKFLRITDIQNGIVNWAEVPSCEIADEDYLKHKLDEGDIVFARTGATTGKSFLITKCEKSVAASYLIRVRLLEGKLLPAFLYLFFQSEEYWNVVSEGTSGSAQGGFNASKLAELEIPFPPIPEQKRIVATLDQAFADIEQARAKTEQNLKNARELFESYLQQVFSDQDEGWSYKTLEEVSLDFGRGKSKHRPRNDASLYGGNYPFIQTGDVRNCEHIITNFTNTYNEKGLAQSKLWPKGTICITIAANIAETGILGFDGCFPDSIIGVVVNPKITTVSYVEFLLQSFKVILKAQGKGSAQDNINMGTFENMKFPFPPVDEQNRIVENLNTLMVSVQQLEAIYKKKLLSIDELKKSILQKAFNGQLTNKKSKGVAA